MKEQCIGPDIAKNDHVVVAERRHRLREVCRHAVGPHPVDGVPSADERVMKMLSVLFVRGNSKSIEALDLEAHRGDLLTCQ